MIESDEWYTPQKYIKSARLVMGSIDVDPCTCEFAQTRVKAATYYTAEHNGLDKVWFGNIWLNPPYSETGKWIDKLKFWLCYQFDAIVLVNSKTETEWYQWCLENCRAFCLVKGRIQFEKEDGVKGTGRSGSTFFYFSNTIHGDIIFRNEFEKYGKVFWGEEFYK